MERMRRWGLLLLISPVFAQSGAALAERTRQYLADLVRLDTTNPPGHETRAAEYLRRVADEQGIEAQLLGPDPARLNFVARLRGSGANRPLLLMAHSDVVPADRSQWTADPFGAGIRDGYLYGRGAQDSKNLLAAELAVLVELKLRQVKLNRDVILLSEADEESGSTGVQWLLAHAPDAIEAEAALNEGGQARELPSGVRLYAIQTSEKIPARVTLVARGGAGHASLPRPDNAILRLSRALLRLEAEQPVRLTATTRTYLARLASLPDYRWLAPLVPRLEDPASAWAAANEIHARDPEIDAQLRTTLSPTMLSAGVKINVIPNTAEAQVDVRRLPGESREEVVARIRKLINDSAVEVWPAGDGDMPPTEPSPIESPVYRAMERALAASAPGAVVAPFMSRGATDGAFLRQRGMAVYGAPVFLREKGGSRAHGNDERISLESLESGAELLWRIVTAIAAEPAP
jgi:acetylornithine deacetylase/succinyl-diaminopimelate desuccinylase-like protein